MQTLNVSFLPLGLTEPSRYDDLPPEEQGLLTGLVTGLCGFTIDFWTAYKIIIRILAGKWRVCISSAGDKTGYERAEGMCNGDRNTTIGPTSRARLGGWGVTGWAERPCWDQPPAWW